MFFYKTCSVFEKANIFICLSIEIIVSLYIKKNL